MNWPIAARRTAWLGAALAAAALLVASAGADTPTVSYGVSVSKGCNSPIPVGSKTQCFCIFGNDNPATTSNDTVTLGSVVDVVTTAGGPVSSGNILSSLSLV